MLAVAEVFLFLGSQLRVTVYKVEKSFVIDVLALRVISFRCGIHLTKLAAARKGFAA